MPDRVKGKTLIASDEGDDADGVTIKLYSLPRFVDRRGHRDDLRRGGRRGEPEIHRWPQRRQAAERHAAVVAVDRADPARPPRAVVLDAPVACGPVGAHPGNDARGDRVDGA